MLECQDLEKSYGETKVLTGVSFTLGRGETLAIMGRSGCGKTTLLKCLNLIERPETGNCILDDQPYIQAGNPLFSLSQIRSQIGMVFQDFNLFPNLTVLRNMSLALEKVKGINHQEANDKATSIAHKLGIEQTLFRYPDTLSGGQAQRVALARAMLLEPQVLLLDEITSALDPETTYNVIKAIQDVRTLDGGDGLSIVLVTHLLPFAIECANRIAFLHSGTILEDLPANDFIDKCQYEQTKDFVNLSNWAIKK